eukprot:5554529-Lingulodinium_polyedra.AAC.1
MPRRTSAEPGGPPGSSVKRTLGSSSPGPARRRPWATAGPARAKASRLTARGPPAPSPVPGRFGKAPNPTGLAGPGAPRRAGSPGGAVN